MTAKQRVVLGLEGGPDSAAAARRQARAAMASWDCDPALTDDVILLLSELVSNAVLHAGAARGAALLLLEDGIRIEVGDHSTVVPAPSGYGVDASTGRGLLLVDALAADWGYAHDDGGKLVWAQVPFARLGDDRTPGDLSGAQGHGVAPARDDRDRLIVRFEDVSVADYLALREQNDAVLRDVDLLLIGAAEGIASPVPPALLAACQRLRTQFGDPAGAYRDRVLAAADAGVKRVDLSGPLPRAGGGPAREYVALLEEIEAFAAEGHLFAQPASPAVARLRRWFVDKVIEQEADAAAGRAGRPDGSGLPDRPSAR